MTTDDGSDPHPARQASWPEAEIAPECDEFIFGIYLEPKGISGASFRSSLALRLSKAPGRSPASWLCAGRL
jgi:hypothetical protein